MPIFEETLNNLFTSTLHVYAQKKTTDQVYKGSVLLRKLKEKGAVKAAEPGIHIREPIRTGKSPIYSIDYREAIKLLPKEIMTAAVYDWRFVVAPLLLYQWELDINTGTSKVLNLMQERMDEVTTGLQENINEQLFTDGTGNGGKDIQGLGLIVHNTGDLGGVAVADSADWAAGYYNSPGSPVVVAFEDMSTAISTISIGGTEPDLIITTQTLWDKLHNDLPDQQRYIDQNIANWGFSNFTVRGKIPVTYDRHCPAGKVYILTTDHLKLRYHSKYHFAPRGFVDVPNMMATANMFTFAGNMTCNSRRTQGLLANRS